MSVTPSFRSSLSPLGLIFAVGVFGWVPVTGLAQAIPSQANIDASAQRRLQETAREAQRQRRIEQQVQTLSQALSPDQLAGSGGAVLTRRALAALVLLREDGIPANDAVTRAIRSARLDSSSSAKPSAYLRTLFAEKSGKITPAILAKLQAGQDPSPALVLPPYAP